MTSAYATLTGSVTTPGSLANWINSSQVQAAAPTIITEAESFIYRRLRHWKMLKRSTGTMSANPIPVATPTDYIAQPSDYLEDQVFFITGLYASQLIRDTEQEIISNYSYNSSGFLVPTTPQKFYTDQTNIYFDVPPDQAYPYILLYYQQLPSLATSGDNFLTSLYPRLIRTACMVGACEFAKDSGQGNFDRTYWEQMAEQELVSAQSESDRQRRSMISGMIIL